MKTSSSRFLHKTLMPDEKIVRKGRIHGFYTFSALVTLALWVMAGFGIQYLFAKYMSVSMPGAVYACTGLGVFQFLLQMLRKWTTEIVMTNSRLLYKRGFFQVDVDEVDIEQLASDNVKQSLTGRLFDYGTVNIRCIEAKDVILADIAEPYEFRNAVEHEKHSYRERYMNVDRVRRHGPEK